MLSLFLTILIFLGIRKIRRHFLFKARAPELVRKLKAAASKLIQSLNDDGEAVTTATYEALADGEAILKSLRTKIGFSSRDITDLLDRMHSFDQDRPKSWGQEWRAFKRFLSRNKSNSLELDDEQKVRQIYHGLMRIVSEANESLHDAEWERV